MKKYLIPIILFIIGIILIISAIIVMNLNSNPIPKKIINTKVNKNKISETLNDSITYEKITLKSNNPIVKKEIDKMNKESKLLSKNNELLDDSLPECESYKGFLKYSKYANIIISQTDDNNYTSVCVQRTIDDNCNGKTIKDSSDSFVFDKNNNKMLNQNELYNIINIDKTIIYSIIQNKLDDDSIKAKDIATDINIFYIGNNTFAISYNDNRDNVYRIIPIVT